MITGLLRQYLEIVGVGLMDGIENGIQTVF